MKKTVFAAIALAAAAAAAAPGQKDPVAEGYMDWEGLTERNHLFGRPLTPSDLRHRAVAYVVLDGAAFTNEKVLDFSTLANVAPVPAAHATQWETQEMPRSRVILVSMRNLPKGTDAKTFAALFRPPKGCDSDKAREYSTWGLNRVAFYRNAKAAGEEELSPDRLPYVAVYGGAGTEPIYKKEKWSPADDRKDLHAAMRKAASALEEWTPPLGVAEPQFFKKAAADFEKGKPTAGILAALKAGIKSKNPDQAKEAQVMFDAINQLKGELLLRILLEFSAAPARARSISRSSCSANSALMSSSLVGKCR